ncbi:MULTISPECIES: DEAD/DEAH box helicase [unclassified Bacillus (in: firmicutes)]|uniref:DEAD/DEAH box helicase n=1 Tax=unclassified Bacillus (in: firmicutes) TaxID=185979 RepID=UPI001BE91CB5|nr:MULTISPECIES: DEAD/DEAH box helicase [unclassified Bacillus (in: firmicutes)]MBT2617971.1 DEAD/DEAH box helicase [Bacillus sp. ISL-78]MBT2631248.1 DEAD/DEAH box helicase [Bacillus sp. ISL-101]MBT2716097.1 DEAD/DEAH box helicase [Bacillus sp. ISL-57]
MDIKLNRKIIKDMCGAVSFKRGEAFHRANKVTFESYRHDGCEASVRGKEDFQVTIEVDAAGGFQTECSCPSLASFPRDCQHIAAVLLSVYDHKRDGTIPEGLQAAGSDATANKMLSEGLLTLFNNQPVRKSVHQRHFENRTMLEVEFTCKPVWMGMDKYMLGLEVKIGSLNVSNVRDFLKRVKEGKPAQMSPSFIYDPSLHCFQNENDSVLQELITVISDEKVYVDALTDKSEYKLDHHLLLLPPSSFRRLVPILEAAPMVKLAYGGLTFNGFRVTNGPLPLRFDFTESGDKGYQLYIKRLQEMIIMNAYTLVLFEGKLVQLEGEDFKRLSELKQMMEDSGMNQIPIHHDQLELFLDKVVPGLKRLGEVHIARSITELFLKTPLVAKLYLDRVKNRLLAGLEFHYENIVINPLEKQESKVMRDVEKEAEIIKLMEDSQFAKTDGGYFLHNEELEYEFLYHIVPKLQRLVQIYATTAVRNRISRGNAAPRIRVKIKKERTNWLEFKFEMDDIPDKQIREILAALEEKRKYYRLRNGSLLSLETREYEEINRFLNALPIQDEDLESTLNMPIVKGLQLLDSVYDGQTFTMEDSFRQFLDNIRNPGALEFTVPNSLDPILRDYQKNGYKWMKILAQYGFGGILADDMGLGKTLQSITFILSELPDIRKKRVPALIVCPSSLTYNWLSEFTKFAPEIQAVVVDGDKPERSKLLKEMKDVDVVITSYPLLRKDIKSFEKEDFHTVFFDEAQAFKNPVTQTARAAKKIKAAHRFALTGTPIENSLEELWSLFHVVFPELFMGLKEYSNLSRKQISRRIRPFLLRRMKEDVLAELPEKIESLESVELLPDQKKLYGAYLAKLRHDTLKHLDKDTLRKNRIRILAGLTRLRQICCHPALFVDGYKGSSAKYEQLMQIVEESKHSGRRVLIFSQFTKMLTIIGRDLAMKGQPFFYLDGQTPSKERVEICNRFNAGERDIFLISLKAGGTGLNLTGADTVILYDLWWNPAVEEQAADRAHRMGQKNEVQVIKLIARGTIEEKMNELQEKKRHLIEEIIDPGDKSSSALTEEDIREILMI